MKYTVEICNRRKERIKRAVISVEASFAVIHSETQEFPWHMSFNEIATEMLKGYTDSTMEMLA